MKTTVVCHAGIHSFMATGYRLLVMLMDDRCLLINYGYANELSRLFYEFQTLLFFFSNGRKVKL